MADDPAGLSIQLLKRVRRGEPIGDLEPALVGYDPDALAADLDDARRKAFWCNVYNAYAQVLIDEYRELYEKSRLRFFGWRRSRSPAGN